MQRFIAFVIPVVVAAGLALAYAPHVAAADVNAHGLTFKAAYAGDAGCLSRFGSSYAAVSNNCGYRVEVVGWLPIFYEGWHNTSVFVYGNNTWCQTVSTNDVGNGAHIGPATWTFAGPDTWQSLNTGSRYVWWWSPLLVRCGLDAGEVIGAAHATW